MTRAEKVQRAQALRAEGLTYKQIGERMGLKKSAAFDYVKDPDGAKLRERHERARGTCEDCEGPTAWSNDSGAAATRCEACHLQWLRGLSPLERSMRRRDVEATWSREKIISAIREAAGSNRQLTQSEYATWARERLGSVPSASSVGYYFETWNDAAHAAGLDCRPDRRHFYSRTTPDECRAAVRSVGDMFGRLPSRQEYEEYRAEHDRSLPSASLIVMRCGRWGELLADLTTSEQVAA